MDEDEVRPIFDRITEFSLSLVILGRFLTITGTVFVLSTPFTDFSTVV